MLVKRGRDQERCKGGGEVGGLTMRRGKTESEKKDENISNQ